MRNFIIGLIVGVALGAAITVIADPSWISEEALWNRVYDSSTGTIRMIGQ